MKSVRSGGHLIRIVEPLTIHKELVLVTTFFQFNNSCEVTMTTQNITNTPGPAYMQMYIPVYKY